MGEILSMNEIFSEVDLFISTFKKKNLEYYMIIFLKNYKELKKYQNLNKKLIYIFFSLKYSSY